MNSATFTNLACFSMVSAGTSRAPSAARRIAFAACSFASRVASDRPSALAAVTAFSCSVICSALTLSSSAALAFRSS